MSRQTIATKHTIGFKDKKGKACIVSPIDGENIKVTYLANKSYEIAVLDDNEKEQMLDKKELKYVLFSLGKNSINNYRKYKKKKEKERMAKGNEVKPKDILFEKIGSKVKVVFIDGKAINDLELIALSKFEINVRKENKEMVIFKHAVKYIQIIEE